jgi:predicted tellurium resistance membrane protein TerC
VPSFSRARSASRTGDSFLLLVGVNLIAEGLEFHIPKGYTYFAMAFSVFVEILNLKTRRRTLKPGSH